jgi:secreted PhoX family phosphatase
MTGYPQTRALAFEESENVGRNPTENPTIGDVIAARYDRREILRGALGVAAIAATVSPLAIAAAQQAHAEGARFPFREVAAGVDEKHHVADGYDADVLIRWGDKVLPGAPAFDPLKQTAAAQKQQFGYNNDYLGYIPMPGAANPSHHGLLVVNLEYTNEELMFPGIGIDQMVKAESFAKMTKELVEIEKAAHGGAVIEIKRENGKWGVVADSKYARRIDADTAMEITGPAAGHDRLKTSTDPSGRKVNGMLNNCAGGVTPWGTWLSCEENFHGYFWGKVADGDRQAASFKRYGVPGNWYAWGKYEDRFDVTKEPNESNRFGWVVEIDPLDPTSTPKKRTAMGRFKHEGAANIINKDGRFVVYQGDDERFDYVYKFVTRGTVDRNNRAANRDLLDDGTLFVAKYNADGTGEWMPLTFGQGPLTAANGFNSQADILIDARRAGDLLGATRMDRPEDAEANPKTNKVYVIFTNNTSRKDNEIDAANPRAKNEFGHIIEMTPPDGDHAAATFKWEILVKCGDPSVAAVGATFSSATTKDGWFGMPDNCAIDSDGRLWISTDGNSDRETGRTDGLWALETDGEGRATSKLFFRCPAGAELCGPEFTPDGETLFVAVQHPGDDGPKWKAFGRPSSFEDPSTRWPDFQPGMPPRPSVLAITKRGGGKIAS